MTLSAQFFVALEKALQIDRFKKFIRTKKAIKNGDELWLLDKEILDKNEYMNAWELILAESLFITLISTLFIRTLQLFTNETTTQAFDIYLNSGKFGYFTSFVSLLFIAITIYFLSKLVIPKKHKKSNDKTGLLILLYHLGARGFVAGLLTVMSISLIIAILTSTVEDGIKDFSIYILIFPFLCLIWMYVLAYFAIAKGRTYYDPDLKHYKFLFKYLFFWLIVILLNSLVMAIISNYQLIADLIGVGVYELPPIDEIIPAIYSYFENMNYKEYILFIQITISSVLFFLGWILFFFSKDKKSILKYSTLMSLVHILGGCSSAEVDSVNYPIIEIHVVDVNFLNGLFELLFYPYEDPYIYRIFLNISLCSLFVYTLSLIVALPAFSWKIITFKNRRNSIICISCIAIVYSSYVFYKLNPEQHDLFIRTSPKQASIKLYKSTSIREIPSDFKTGNIDSRADKGEFLFDEGIYNVTVSMEGYKERRIRFRLIEDEYMNIRLTPIDKDGDLVSDIYDKCDNTKPRQLVDTHGCSKIQVINGLLEAPEIVFDYDSTKIDQSYSNYLETVGDFLIKNDKVKLLIQGHTSYDEGDPEYCLALGESRARAVFIYLVSLGVNKKQLSTVSYGKEKPIFKTKNMRSFEKNRRITFVM